MLDQLQPTPALRYMRLFFIALAIVLVAAFILSTHNIQFDGWRPSFVVPELQPCSDVVIFQPVNSHAVPMDLDRNLQGVAAVRKWDAMSQSARIALLRACAR